MFSDLISSSLLSPMIGDVSVHGWMSVEGSIWMESRKFRIFLLRINKVLLYYCIVLKGGGTRKRSKRGEGAGRKRDLRGERF